MHWLCQRGVLHTIGNERKPAGEILLFGEFTGCSGFSAQLIYRTRVRTRSDQLDNLLIQIRNLEIKSFLHKFLYMSRIKPSSHSSQ